jgi:hypothetical protein
MYIPAWIIITFYICCCIWIVALFLFAYLKARRNPLFPIIDEKEFIFREHRASGYSNKSLLSKIYSSNGCLTVRVTKTELWISIPNIIALFSKTTDMNHRVRLMDITELRHDKKYRVYVSFHTEENETRTVSLKLDNPLYFIEKIEDAQSRLLEDGLDHRS